MSGFDVPVAILNFNRPHLTRRVFEVVKQIKPRTLFVVTDGPRANCPDDVRLCAEVRAIFDEIDWECEVHKKFSDTNLGSNWSNAIGLDWIFNTVEEAIIIEDDCVPSLSFFPYCKELLDRYRDDPKVGVITGYNLGFPASLRSDDSYFFSAYTLNWAWASWRRVWKQVDMEMSWWKPKAGKKMLKTLFPEADERRYWYRLYEDILNGNMKNAWDYQMILSAFKNSQYCIIPYINMVSNIGFGPEAANCRDQSMYQHMDNLPRGEMGFPLVHPAQVQRSMAIDSEIFRIRFRPRALSLSIRIKVLLLKCWLIRVLNSMRKKAFV